MSLRIWEIDWLLLDQFIHLKVIIATSIEGRESNNHFVGQDSESPPIYWEAVSFLVENFRCQIFWGTAERVSLSIAFEDLGKTEVSQADVTIFVHQDVLWLKISVDDMLFVQVANCKSYLNSVELCLLFWEASAVSQVHEQLTSSNKSHNEKDFLFSLEDVVHANQERVIGLHENLLL